MKNVLIVDDEKPFLLSLSDGLSAYKDDFNVLTANNGKEAVGILKSARVDLVVTDLKMPKMDGLQLMAHMSGEYPDIPVIVMTAFGTPDIEEKIDNFGAIQYLEKPLDFTELADKIFDGLSVGSKGYINGITLPTFLQLIEMEKLTSTLTIKSRGRTGQLFFFKGILTDAETETLTGKEAAYEIVSWENTEIEIKKKCKRRQSKIDATLNYILMEGSRLKDEAVSDERRVKESGNGQNKEEAVVQGTKKLDEIPIQREVNVMAVHDKLKEFASLEGFGGVALFTPTGEALAMVEASGSKANIKEIGVLANNVLLNAQKASLDMGTGRGQLVHVEAERAHFLVRCLNEGTDPLKSQPGKAHIHMVLILMDDSSIGMAKMKINSVVQAVAEEFRM